MEPRARFSVWRSAEDAQRNGADHVTWNGARLEWDARNAAEDDDITAWYIWDHSAIPPENVTDGHPSPQEAPGEPLPWWVCRYIYGEYTASGPYKPSEISEVEDGEEVSALINSDGLSVSATFQYQEKPSYETFAHVVADRLGINLPEEKEQQWCWTTEGGWKLMDGNMVNRYSSPEYKRMENGNELIRVYGTIHNREERKDAVRKVMKQAGPKNE